jgi:hypothetical protein
MASGQNKLTPNLPIAIYRLFSAFSLRLSVSAFKKRFAKIIIIKNYIMLG